MRFYEVLNIKCLEIYEQIVAFSYLRKKEETILVASCLGAENDQGAIKLASELLNLSSEQATALSVRVLRDAGIGCMSEDIELKNKLQSVVSIHG